MSVILEIFIFLNKIAILITETKLMTSENKQISLIIRGSAVLWLITKAFSYKTWIADRKYPVIAPLDFLQNVPEIIHPVLFAGAMLFLFGLIFSTEKYLLSLFLIIEFLSCGIDTVRWQPWEFMYFCIFLVYLLNFKTKTSFSLLVHLFLASIYIFSGLHKFNRSFLSTVWTKMVLQDFFNLSIGTILNYKLFFAGLIIPFTEFSAGVLLLFSKHKRKITYLLIAVHLLVLIFIGPFGLNYNPIVWIWNLAMIFLLITVYLKPIESTSQLFLKKNILWLFLWFVMPVFSFFGMWYQYFSSSLYTGKEKQLIIYISKENKEYVMFSKPSELNSNKDYYTVNLQDLALEEIKSAPLPEKEIYQKIGVFFRKRLGTDCRKIILYDPQTGKKIQL